MELKDLVVTPIILFLVYALAYFVRPYVTDSTTRRYFIPALTVKIIGAIAVGLIYQFYYGGGDTFAFHTYGSRVIWEAFQESVDQGLRLLLSDGDYTGGVYKYASRIWYYRDPQSFFIIRVAAVFDLLTFSTYSATAALFAVVSFSGLWALFITFQRKHPTIHLLLAVAVLFVPSVFFWGSGILKDTLTIGCLGWLTYSFSCLFISGRYSLLYVLIFFLCSYIIFSIKIYILLCFLQAAILWFFLSKLSMLRSLVLRVLVTPVVLLTAGLLAYYAINRVAEDNPKYSLDKIAETAKVTAYDIRYGWGARDGVGAGYNLGELDGTFTGMIKLAPEAINVSLFRPYIWEVQNPLMLLSSIESIFFLLLTVFVLVKVGPRKLFIGLSKPDVVFCLVFSLVFAFSVGISTYNFGSLSRYKIPLMPYYLTALILIWHYAKPKRERNADLVELTE